MSDCEENKDETEDEDEAQEGSVCGDASVVVFARKERRCQEEETEEEDRSFQAHEEGTESDARNAKEAGDKQGRDQGLLRNGRQELDTEASGRTEDGVPKNIREAWNRNRRNGRGWYHQENLQEMEKRRRSV